MTTCTTCRHFCPVWSGAIVMVERPARGEELGECRRFPPITVAPEARVRSGSPLLANREWPFVYGNDACGEHAPRTEGSPS